ncbi:DUF4381 domain-containing protein [Agrobacterium tumefaciens]|uniref:DUF4381 domain-containing protein n=1 Tax=Agrobacterium tumefaciens TaxID=358 RepID=UPI0012B8F542|nr:DUF4381 domain-containing protein [Agrobacterium tumefaciens]MQB07709.1 DUF4381 domain-containing protein [Agrobacterium tumefaciens]
MEQALSPVDPVTRAALGSLKDIAVPQPVSWMPQTWGWALVAIIVLVATFVVLVHSVKKYRKNAYRREALVLLGGIEERLKDPARSDAAIHELSEILKRVALAGWSRRDVASLSGAAWARFLETQGYKDRGHVLQTLLDDYEYRSASEAGALTPHAVRDFLSAVRTWIRQHHVSA